MERNNRQYTFRDKTIYINEHLTPNNKHLFALAKQKKIAANYKYLWMRNGRVLIRKADNSEIINIDSEEIINSL